VKAEGITTPEELANYLVEKGSADLKEGRMALENQKKHGHKDWYSWSNANWGTKWNAYSQQEQGLNKIEFQTAWSTPLPVIEKLSEMFPEVQITLRFADEDFGHNCGEIIFKDNVVISEYTPDGGSSEALMLAGDVQGYGLDTYFECYGETENSKFALDLIQGLSEKYPLKEVFEAIIGCECISKTFLNVSMEVALGMEEYEMIPKIKEKLKELQEEGE
jgi:hypothetical protein